MDWPQYYVINGSPLQLGVNAVENQVEKSGIEATNWPTSIIWFQTKAEAQAYVNSHGGGTTAGTSATAGAVNAATGAAEAAASGFSFSWPTFTNLRDLTIRAAKIFIGGILVIVGVMKLTGADSAVINVASKIPVVPV
jgi:hypothetical protein